MESAVAHCLFALNGQQARAEVVRDKYDQYIEGTLSYYNPSALIDDDHPAFVAFVDALRDALKDYLDAKGNVGNGLAAVMGGTPYLPLEQYAKTLLRGGASLGADKVICILQEWIAGIPVCYRVCHALANIYAGDPLTLDISAGVQVSTVPMSTAQLYRQYPHLRHVNGLPELTGSILVTATIRDGGPGIFKPENVDAMPSVLHLPVRGFEIEPICVAMTLLENKNVQWMCTWGDFGVLPEINCGISGGCYHNVPNKHNVPNELPDEITLSEDRLKAIPRICEQLDANTGKQLKIAIYRWLRSKDHLGLLENQFIDLRIALEALYAGRGGEVRFRQATHGALHLGRDYEKRQSYRDLLIKVYDVASRVVHAREVQDTKENRDLLARGCDACRKGILECLEDGGDIDFDRLMFDRQ